MFHCSSGKSAFVFALLLSHSIETLSQRTENEISRRNWDLSPSARCK